MNNKDKSQDVIQDENPNYFIDSLRRIPIVSNELEHQEINHITIPNEEERNSVYIGCIDIGKRNFAQCIEQIPSKTIRKIKKKWDSLPKKRQRKVKGKMNSDIESIHKDLFQCGTIINMGVYDFIDEEADSQNARGQYMWTDSVRSKLFIHLNDHRDLWDLCDAVFIEQQYFNSYIRKNSRKGISANVDAIKIAEAVMSWFRVNYPYKQIEYFGSQNKTQIFGAPSGLTDFQRKRWAIKKAEEIIRIRKDVEIIFLFDFKDKYFRKRPNLEKQISILNDISDDIPDFIYDLCFKVLVNRQKLDDVSDCCLMCQAVKFKKLIAEF